jgi:glycine dehydrogenase subunit 2
VQLVRHFTRLSQRNFGVDTHFYPLGSCTMKYNPKINEKVAALDGFANLHPYQPEDTIQGILRLMYEMEKCLNEICGMDRFTLQPAAGAHGELLGLMLVKAYHTSKDRSPTRVIVPDTSHGTWVASRSSRLAAMA